MLAYRKTPQVPYKSHSPYDDLMSRVIIQFSMHSKTSECKQTSLIITEYQIMMVMTIITEYQAYGHPASNRVLYDLPPHLIFCLSPSLAPPATLTLRGSHHAP